MHPVIQMTIAVAMVVMATRMWPPLLYWLAGAVIFLSLVKGVRRTARWLKNKVNKNHAIGVLKLTFVAFAWVVLAMGADRFFPGKISAVSIVLCFICAFLVIAILLSAAEWLRRHLPHR